MGERYQIECRTCGESTSAEYRWPDAVWLLRHRAALEDLGVGKTEEDGPGSVDLSIDSQSVSVEWFARHRTCDLLVEDRYVTPPELVRSVLPWSTSIDLPNDRGLLVIRDTGDANTATISPALGGAVATDRLRWLRDAVLSAGEYLNRLCDKGAS